MTETTPATSDPERPYDAPDPTLPAPVLLAEGATINPPPWNGVPQIVLRGASKWYAIKSKNRVRQAIPGRARQTPPPNAVIALDDVDLVIGEGQSVGVIGNNGAGKSTLLRLVASVTAPSKGLVGVRGPVASMIELGLGFHPQMTGAENLHFAAGLLGMSPRTLAKRWDDIVDFSGIAHALDQPVKQYSSGMLARLGFALASHSDAETILVDEVLSVGDFDFQRRSLERIMSLNREGRTTIIVTHMLDALPPLCHRIIQLDKGTVVADGTPREVLPEYVAQEARKYAASGNDSVHITEVEIDPPAVQPNGAFTVRGLIETTEPMPGCKVVLRVGLGAALMAWAGEAESQSLERLAEEPLDIPLHNGPGKWRVEATVRNIPFFPGDYNCGLAVVESDMSEVISQLVPLDILGVREDWKSLRLALDQNNDRLDKRTP
jgi:ABC-type polysaccharide/polyol phosphate transport system ATPase subunit